MKTLILTALLSLSPTLAAAHAGPTTRTSPEVAVTAAHTDTVLRISQKATVAAPARPDWGVTFAGLPLSTWTDAASAHREPARFEAPRPFLTLFEIRF